MIENNTTYTYFIDALKNRLFLDFNLNRAALARAVGFSHSYITNIINYSKPASYEAQTQIAMRLGFKDLFSFLEFGKTLQPYDAKAKKEKQNERADFVFIPKVEARPAAGNGSFETSSNTLEVYSFRASWMRIIGNPKDMVLMDVVGDSMHPYIMDNDMVMIDKSRTDLVPNKVYAVRVEDLIYLKYIDRTPGQFILRSHNKEYDPIYIDTQFLSENSIAILGRAVWWCHVELAK